MGTRGYKVYRYKGRYFVYYNHWDSYPSVFGLRVLRQVPRDVAKEVFEEWVRLTREHLDEEYEKLKNSSPQDTDYVTDEQPKNDLFIEWIYEIDLDNLVFHVDSQPLFRLDNMPPDKVFLKSISYDHFGHRAFFEHTPVQFRYNWRAPPPPPLPTSLIAYNSCPNLSSTSSVNELLCTLMPLSTVERTRTALVELLVAQCMTKDSLSHDVRVLESAPDRDHISQSMLELALSLVNFAVGPPLPELPCNPHGNTWDFIWVRKDICLRITTHLDDEGNLQASIGDLVHHINTTRDKVGTVYGIACSIFHCAIVRLDKDKRGTSFAHTPALQFLPSFYARKITTPGIVALSRLGCQSSGVEFLSAISEAYKCPLITHPELSVTGSLIANVPVEVWTNVGHFVTSPKDLVNLASISPQAMSAAADLARYPWVMEFRLVDVVGSILPILETAERTIDQDHNEMTAYDDYYDENKKIRNYHYQLGRAKFTAVSLVKGGRYVTVELGQKGQAIGEADQELGEEDQELGEEYQEIGEEYQEIGEEGREINNGSSFEVQTYLSGLVIFEDKKLYISELEDDGTS